MFRADLTAGLIIAACFSAVAIAWLLRKAMPLSLAVPIAFLKVSLPFVYFAFFFDAQWTFLDDGVYLRHAQDLLDHGYGPFASLGETRFYVRLFMLSQGIHFFYTWWNLFALWLFGPHYWAPVYLNILVSSGAVVTFSRLLSDGELPSRYRLYAVVFFALNFEILAWSSVFNLKDVLVMALSLVALRRLLLISAGHVRVGNVFALLGALAVLMGLRYYVPAMLVGSTCLWALFSLRGLQRPTSTAAIVAASLVIGGWVATHAGRSFSYLHVENIAFGVLRFLLTPQPWSLEDNYTFLLVPSIVNWALVPLLFFGIVRLWRDVPELRLMVFYGALMAALYGITPELNGPRERIQLIPIMSLAIFHGAYSLLAEYRASRWNGVVASAPS